MTTTALAERPTMAVGLQPLPADIEKVLVEGNLAALKPEQRVAYYNRTCESLGLNPFTTPFDYLNLNGKLRLYAKKDATDQLRRRYDVTVRIVAREKFEDVHVVTARATLPSGREDESIGAVPVKGKTGEELANAWMKAETKAKRRVTLSICGLGFLDESEIEGVRGATRVTAASAHSVASFTDSGGGDVVDDVTGEVVNEPLRVVKVEQKKNRTGEYWRVIFSDGRIAFTDNKSIADTATDFEINRSPIEDPVTEQQNGGTVLVELCALPGTAADEEPLISESQRKRMLAIAAKGGMDHAAVKVMLAADYQITSTTLVPVRLYDEIIGKLEPTTGSEEAERDPF